MDEGCLVVFLVILGIGVVLAIIYFIVLAIAYGFAYLGMTIIIPIDYLASSFTLIGIESPAVGWLFIGSLAGTIIGLVKGLKKAGRTSDLWKVYLGAGLLAALLLLCAYGAYPPEFSAAPDFNKNSSPVIASTSTSTKSLTSNVSSNTTRPKVRSVKSSSQVTVGTTDRFDVRMIKGFINANSIVIEVRETSVNYTGGWFPWRSVISASYLTDSANNTYYPDVNQSTGWMDGNVRPGSYREGRIFFNGSLPSNVQSMNLYFAYYPGNTSGQFAVLQLSLN